MRKRTNILTGLVLVCLLAGSGTYAYLHSSKDTKLTSTTTQPQTTTQQPTTNTTATPEQTAQPTNQFDIPELGIRMTLPAGLEDLEYVTSTNPYGLPEVSLGSGSLNNINDSKSFCATKDAPLGTLTRYEFDPRTKNEPSGAAFVKHLGAYYFAYFHPQQGCTANEALSNLQNNKLEILLKALNSMSL